MNKHIGLFFGWIALLWGNPLAVMAQQKEKLSVTAKVLYNDGSPAEMAIILLREARMHTQADENGRFRIENIPAGKIYTLEVKPFGNQSFSQKIDLREKSQNLTIRLPFSAQLSLGEVIVSGKNKTKLMREKGFAVGVVNTQKAAVQNLQTTEILGRTSGVKIRQSAGMGSSTSFNINGLTGNSVRIFIDGIPLANYGRSFSVSNIPPALIERIEVYKGVLPTELSQDALGGGVNIILKKDLQNSLSTSYAYGSFNTHQWDLNANYRAKKSGLTANISAFYNYSDNNYKVWGENVYVTNYTTGRKNYITAERFHDRYRSQGVRANVGFSGKNWADDLSVGLMLSSQDKDIQNGATMQVVYGNRKTDSKTALGNFRFRKKNFIKNWDFDTYATLSKNLRNVNDTDPHMYTWEGKVATRPDGSSILWQRGGGEAGAATLAQNHETNIANRSNLRFRFAKNHRLSVNYFFNYFYREVDDPYLHKEAREAMDKRNYRKQIIGVNYENALFNKRLKSNLFYKNYSQNISLTEVRSLRQGTQWRLQKTKHNRSVNDHGYGATLSFMVFSKWQILLSAERAIRLPGSTELLGNYSESINPSYTLVPENSLNYNAGFHLGDFRWRKHSLWADVNFFVRNIRDMIVQAAPKNTDDYYNFENLGKVLSQGIDTEIKYNWANKLFWNTSFSYTDARFNLEYNEHGIRYFQYKSRLRNLPYLMGNTNLEYHLPNILLKGSRLMLSYNLSYTHEFFRDWENFGSANKITIPTQVVHDLGLVYTFPNRHFTLGIDAKNLLDAQVFDNYALQKPGRAFFGKITYTLF